MVCIFVFPQFFNQVCFLNVTEKLESLKPHGEVQMDKIESLQNVVTIIHLARQSNANATWELLLKDNIEGYLFE